MSESGGGGYGHGPRTLRREDLTYESYLKIDELLQLQVPVREPAHNDEMLFIIIHQTYELWFKHILQELDLTIRYMNQGEVLEARHFLTRVVEVMKLMVQQIHILETMRPVDFLTFRSGLNPASGFQSIQFREIEFLAGIRDENYYRYFAQHPEAIERLKRRAAEPDLRVVYYGLLRRLGFKVPDEALDIARGPETQYSEATRGALLGALLEIYQNPDHHLPLYLLTEALVDLDESLSLWRYHHVKVVERIIGRKQGTGGSSGVDYLERTLSKKAFPLLWEVRSHLVQKS